MLRTITSRVGVAAAACACALFVFAQAAAAQTSIFTIPLDRTGTPAVTTVETIDPLTGEPITTTVDTGAFVNPCTGDWVNVTGSTTIAISQSVDKFGTLKLDIDESAKGLGVGWTPNFTRLTGSNYVFTDRQGFTLKFYVGAEFYSDFSDRFSMKGAKSTDNWVMRAQFRVKVSADGSVQVFLIKTSADGCRG